MKIRSAILESLYLERQTVMKQCHFSLLSFKKEREVYDITSLSVRLSFCLCVSVCCLVLTFKQAGRSP
jgi:hypothetical protein